MQSNLQLLPNGKNDATEQGKQKGAGLLPPLIGWKSVSSALAVLGLLRLLRLLRLLAALAVLAALGALAAAPAAGGRRRVTAGAALAASAIDQFQLVQIEITHFPAPVKLINLRPPGERIAHLFGACHFDSMVNKQVSRFEPQTSKKANAI